MHAYGPLSAADAGAFAEQTFVVRHETLNYICNSPLPRPTVNKRRRACVRANQMQSCRFSQNNAGLLRISARRPPVLLHVLRVEMRQQT
jgi:hypothetical protein